MPRSRSRSASRSSRYDRSDRYRASRRYDEGRSSRRRRSYDSRSTTYSSDYYGRSPRRTSSYRRSDRDRTPSTNWTYSQSNWSRSRRHSSRSRGGRDYASRSSSRDFSPYSSRRDQDRTDRVAAELSAVRSEMEHYERIALRMDQELDPATMRGHAQHLILHMQWLHHMHLASLRRHLRVPNMPQEVIPPQYLWQNVPQGALNRQDLTQQMRPYWQHSQALRNELDRMQGQRPHVEREQRQDEHDVNREIRAVGPLGNPLAAPSRPDGPIIVDQRQRMEQRNHNDDHNYAEAVRLEGESRDVQQMMRDMEDGRLLQQRVSNPAHDSSNLSGINGDPQNRQPQAQQSQAAGPLDGPPAAPSRPTVAQGQHQPQQVHQQMDDSNDADDDSDEDSMFSREVVERILRDTEDRQPQRQRVPNPIEDARYSPGINGDQQGDQPQPQQPQRSRVVDADDSWETIRLQTDRLWGELQDMQALFRVRRREEEDEDAVADRDEARIRAEEDEDERNDETLIRSAQHGPCIICHEETVAAPSKCTFCENFLGCKKCATRWYRRALRHNPTSPACPLCRHRWEGTACVTAMDEVRVDQ